MIDYAAALIHIQSHIRSVHGLEIIRLFLGIIYPLPLLVFIPDKRPCVDDRVVCRPFVKYVEIKPRLYIFYVIFVVTFIAVLIDRN